MWNMNEEIICLNCKETLKFVDYNATIAGIYNTKKKKHMIQNTFYFSYYCTKCGEELFIDI